MGIFSFWKSKGEGAGDHVSGTGAPPPAPPAAWVEHGTASDTAKDEPVLAVPRSRTPPADPAPEPAPDLNTAALTAPPAGPSAEAPPVGPSDPAQVARFQSKIVDVLKTVYDPEIPVDIYELGLIYDILVDAESRALIKMTLTSPACPSAQQLPSEVRYKVKAVEGIADAWVDIVWEPPWDKDRMSEAAKLQLGFF